MPAISLFSNCGAGDVGYRRAGFRFAVMAELEEQRMEVCALNHHGTHAVPGDLRETWPTVVAAWREQYGDSRPELLCACPPCQGMSSARAKRGHDNNPLHGNRDERNLLVEVVAKVILETRPRVVVLENVPTFLSRQVLHPDFLPPTEEPRGITAPRLLLERVSEQYRFFPVLVDLADYGVPQRRKRAFITLVHVDEPWLADLEASGHLPFPAPTTAAQRVSFAEWFAQPGHQVSELDHVTMPADPADPLHAVSPWKAGDRRYDLINATPPDGGSAWLNTRCKNGHDNPGVSKEAIRCTHPECQALLLRPVVKNKKTGEWRLITGFHNTSYRRLDSREVASTVTTASGHIGSDVNLHPTQNRVLSPRECAELQTFPRDFNWGKVLKDKSLNKIRCMIGEAVPPLFTQAHGEVLASLLANSRNYANMLPATDQRAVDAQRKFMAEPAPLTQQLVLELTTQLPIAAA